MGRDRSAQGTGQRVGGQVGGVKLAGAQPTELVGDRVGADARCVEQRRAADKAHGGAGGGDGGAAPAGAEPCVEDTVADDRDRQGDLVAAGVPAGGGGVPLRRPVALALG